MAQGWTAGPAPETSAWTPGPMSAPDFTTTSVPAEQTFPSKAWDWANTPLVPQIAAAAHAISDHMDTPRLDQSKTLAQIKGFLAGATGAAGDVAGSFTSPVGLALTLAGLGEESAIAKAVPAVKSLLALPEIKTLQRAVQATGGVGFMAHGATRVVNAPDAAGKLQGAAEMAAGALGATSAARGTPAPTAARLSPTEAAANAFAEQRGIPLDAATATGSRFVRGVQKVSGESLLGAPAAERAQAAQASALTRVGGELANDAHPTPVTSEQAGTNIGGSIRKLLTDLHQQASSSYDALRAMEADPANAAEVPRAPTRDELVAKAQRSERSQQSIGRTPTDAELSELRRIRAELDALPYQPGKLVSDNAGVNSDTHYVPRSAGAPVYDDILQSAPGTSRISRGDVLKSIDSALETGHFTNAAKGALEVAQQRLRGGSRVSKPMLPPSAGDEAVPTQTMVMPVDIRSAKTALAPMYQQLKREAELVPLQGGRGRALVALDRLMNGPDHAPVSVVDGALGDLKAMARADIPELRTDGQGKAALAVRELEQTVQTAVKRAGPAAVRALTEGRAATVAKYQVGDVLTDLAGRSGDAEPVAIMRRLTAPKDANVQLLRRVRDVAPQQMPEVARAKLEDLLGQATERGRFDHADKLYAEWQKLGGETKKILFQQPGQREALDHFFLLAKRIGENPNPSGTAPTMIKTGEAVGMLTHPLATLPASLTMGGLSKVLYTRAGVQALTRFMAQRATRPTGATLRSAAQTAGWAEVVAAARAAGVPLGVPATAGSTDTGETRR